MITPMACDEGCEGKKNATLARVQGLSLLFTSVQTGPRISPFTVHLHALPTIFRPVPQPCLREIFLCFSSTSTVQPPYKAAKSFACVEPTGTGEA